MKSHKLLTSLGVFILIIGLLHFVPIYNKTGYIDHGKNNQAVTCMGYLSNQPHYYRIISGGFDDFKSDKDNYINEDISTSDCGIEPVTLRLYIL